MIFQSKALLLAALLSGFLFIGVSACGSDEPDPTGNLSGAARAPVEERRVVAEEQPAAAMAAPQLRAIGIRSAAHSVS